MSTEYYADYIKKTTFDPESHSTRSKMEEHHEKDENGKVIEHPIEEDSGSSMSSFQGQSYQRQYGDNSGVNPHNHEAHAKAAFKSGMRSKSAIVKHVEKKTGEKIHPDVHKMIHNSPDMKEAATDVKKKPASKTPKVEVEPTEVPEENLDEKGKGLWANIHAKRARGEKPNPPGHPDRPSAADLKRSQNEELHGDQHKLDHNKDNKIDKADMKMVRKKGSVKNHPMAEKKSLASLRNASEFDGKERLKKMQSQKPAIKPVTTTYQAEATFKVSIEGLPTMYIDGAGAGEIKTSLRKQLKDPKTITSIEKISPTEKKKELRAKVAEEDRVDELSPSTKMSYVRKAASDIDNRSYAQGVDDVKGQGNDYDGANNKRIGNRLKGIKRATKEENQVDEISGKTLASYSQKANLDMYGRGLRKGIDMERGSSSMGGKPVSDKDNDRKIKNRGAGISKANMRMAGKMAKHNEDAESVDELSRDTLGSYIQKASDASKYKKLTTKKVDNRYSGVSKASDKIDKMEEDYSDQKSHLKKVGKGGQVSYTNSGKKMTGEYGGLKNKGGRSYAMVHHKTHSAMVPLPQINHKESVEKTDEGIMDAISKVKSGASNMVSNYKKKRNIAAPGKGTNYLGK